MRKTYSFIAVLVIAGLVALPLLVHSGNAQKEAQAFIDSYTGTFKILQYEAAEAEWASNTHIVEGDTMNAYRTRMANEALAEFTGSKENIETARDWVNVGRKFGKPAAWAMLIAGSILLGLLHWPSLKNALRWPGVTLFLTGVVFFITGKVLESQVPDRLAELVERGANQVSGIPPSVTDLGGDLLRSFGKELTGGIDGAALVLIIIGALLIGASLLISLL
ncbi:MAG: hypothetical protein IH969_06050, partial [Candidatus Krumholzibacteriota bacterium]|nr:hypothetical protein [Candidatus Krumholzibacteriota bacterium]